MSNHYTYKLTDICFALEEKLTLISQDSNKPEFYVDFHKVEGTDINSKSIEFNIIDDLTATILIPPKGTIKIVKNKISVSHIDELNEYEKIILLSETVLPMIHALNGAIVLHASSVCENGICKCFLGPSGSGKSTQAALAQLRGGKVLAQDVTVLKYKPDIDSFFVLPGSVFIELRKNSADFFSDEFTVLTKLNDKYIFRANLANPCELNEINIFKNATQEIKLETSADFFQFFMTCMFVPKFYLEHHTKLLFDGVEKIFNSTQINIVEHESDFDNQILKISRFN